jgi:hypothetical protein
MSDRQSERRGEHERLSTVAVEDLVLDLVRVHLPWAQLEEDSFEFEGLLEREQLGSVYLPWYRTVAGDLWHGDIHDPDPADPPVPVQVRETEAMLALYPPTRRASILRLRDDYVAHRYPQAFYVVAGALAGGQLMLADGAHRLSALWLSAVEFRIAALVVRPQRLDGCTDLERLNEHLSLGPEAR